MLCTSQYIGHQVTIGIGLSISSQCGLIIRSTVDVMKNRGGQPSSGELPKVSGVVTVFQAHGFPDRLPSVTGWSWIMKKVQRLMYSIALEQSNRKPAYGLIQLT